MVKVYKGKGDALACGLYRGIKLLEPAMEVLERVLIHKNTLLIHLVILFVFFCAFEPIDLFFQPIGFLIYYYRDSYLY